MPVISFPPPPSSNATHALAIAILNYKPDWAKIALDQGADVFAKNPRAQGQTLLAQALIAGLRASKSREKSVSGRMFADGQMKTAAVLLEHSRNLPIERFSLFDSVVARNLAAINHNLQQARLAESDACLSETAVHGRLMRMASYDAYGISFDCSLTGNLSVFISLAWHNWITSLFEVRGTGHIYAGAHHHKTSSASGRIHNDYNSAWFSAHDAGEIRFPDHSQCAYKTGAGPLPPAGKVQVFRAVAMIFYLHNDGWKEGMGETGLCDSRKAPVDQPSVRIAPRNNSMILFECRPRSYHALSP